MALTPQELSEIITVMKGFWPPPPEWTDERVAGFSAVLGVAAAGIEVIDVARAISRLAGEPDRRVAPPPAQVMATAAVCQRERMQEERTRQAVQAPDDANLPTMWPTDRPCPRPICTGKLWLNRRPAYLLCRTCNSVVVQEEIPFEAGSQHAKYFTHRQRYHLTYPERAAVKTLPPADVDWKGHHPGRVVGEWLRRGGSQGGPVEEELAAVAASMPAHGTLATDEDDAVLKARMRELREAGMHREADRIGTELQHRHMARRSGDLVQAREHLAGMFDAMAARAERATPAPPAAPPEEDDPWHA